MSLELLQLLGTISFVTAFILLSFVWYGFNRPASAYHIIQLREVAWTRLHIIAAHSDREARKMFRQYMEAQSGSDIRPAVLLRDAERGLIDAVYIPAPSKEGTIYFVSVQDIYLEKLVPLPHFQADSSRQALEMFLGSPDYWDHRFSSWSLIETGTSLKFHEISSGRCPDPRWLYSLKIQLETPVSPLASVYKERETAPV